MPAPILREAVRAVILTPDREVLLMRAQEPVSKRVVWFTPGGGMEPGETHEACLLRELLEETGLRIVQPGPLIWTRFHQFEWAGRTVPQQESYYLVTTDRFDPTFSPVTADETATFRGFRWWTVSDIAASPDLFAPRLLATYLQTLIHSGPPASPVQVGI